MRVEISNSKMFKNSVEAISSLVNEGIFVLDEEKMHLKATDPSQIAMVIFELPKESFDSYEVDGEEKLGVDFDFLKKILKRAKATDKIVLEKKESLLKIIFEGKGIRSFSLQLLDISSTDLPDPKISFETSFKIRAKAFLDVLKDASIYANHITIQASKDKIRFYTSSTTKGEFDSIFDLDSEDIFEINAGGEEKATFSLDFLTDMVKHCPSADPIKVYLKNNAPIKLEYFIDDAKFTYWLAPRLEE